MANVKISELAAVTSLTSTDVLPSVAGSTTSKITVQNLANSLTQVSSSISASFATTASYFGGSVVSSSYAVTSSFAVSASWAPGGASVVSTSGSTLYSTNLATSNFSADNSILLGFQAGQDATNAIYSNFIGYQAGYSAPEAIVSNFIGVGAGFNADSASYSNFIGQNAGQSATKASFSNFIGWAAGSNATSASYSTFIGTKAGSTTSPGTNNIIIGNNISLPNGTIGSINIGGIIFATGSYPVVTGNNFTGSMTDAKVGINKLLPQYTLDVSGSLAASSFVILSQVSQSLNFANDTAAQAGGVPLGGLYRSGSFMLIRLV